MQIMKFAVGDDQTPHVGVVEGDAVIAVGRGHRCLTEISALR